MVEGEIGGSARSGCVSQIRFVITTHDSRFAIVISALASSTKEF